MELWIKIDAQAMIVVAIAAAIIIIIRLVPWERRRHDEAIHITGVDR
jgi:hypothetical protein